MTSLNFLKLPHSSKDVVSGDKMVPFNDSSFTFTDRSYLLIATVGFSLSKTKLGTTVKPDFAPARNGGVALDAWARFCGVDRESQWSIPGPDPIGVSSVPEVVMAG